MGIELILSPKGFRQGIAKGINALEYAGATAKQLEAFARGDTIDPRHQLRLVATETLQTGEHFHAGILQHIFGVLTPHHDATDVPVEVSSRSFHKLTEALIALSRVAQQIKQG